jgi:ABC-type sugar transport system ATPase subunit
MNTLSGRVTGGSITIASEESSSDRRELAGEQASIPMPAGLAAAVAAAGASEVTLGVRPEHVRVGTDGPLPATVSVIESLGYERHVLCRLPDGQPITARVPSTDPVPGEGSAVRLGTEVDDLHLFDTGTGARIDARPAA